MYYMYVCLSVHLSIIIRLYVYLLGTWHMYVYVRVVWK